MKTNHKYVLAIADRQIILLPRNRIIRDVQMQFSKPCIWCEVDTDSPMQQETFLMRGTGHILGEAEHSEYIGTLHCLDGAMVYHVYSLGVTR